MAMNQKASSCTIVFVPVTLAIVNVPSTKHDHQW
jgi:hypothetical protein